ncbi:MAG: hypothetical protein RI907_1534 [Pseudomonadota bacterium]|jgi:putative hydroxymethylpyrimidine transporter CytX
MTQASTPLPTAALAPVPADQRVFDGFSQAALWFSLGVGLLVMQVGAYLVPATSTRDALLAIAIGSVVGAGLLAWTARLACERGLSSAGLMHTVYGSGFARLPVLLNIVQLVGWTTFELVIMGEGTRALANQAGVANVSVLASTLPWGVLLALLMSGSMLTLVRGFVSRIGLPLVILSLLWLSWHFWGVLQQQGVQAFMNRPGDGSMGLLSAIDLVVAMPISWLPLVADYARHGRSAGGTMRGTWIGYALANAWCYALGVLVASVSAPGGELVGTLLLAQGGLLALGLILLDEVDNAYGDTYSAAVSLNTLAPKVSVRRFGVPMALACTALACVLPMHGIEPFLLMLSSVFVPLFGVIIGRLAGRSGEAADGVQLPKVDIPSAGLWLLGIGMFHALTAWAPQWGATLPTLVVTMVLARVMRP